MSKIIKCKLIKNETLENVIRFIFNDEDLDLNLESNDSEEIKKIFIKLSEQLREEPIELDYDIDSTIDTKNDALFIDATNEYIEQLKSDLLIIENDEDLKKLRKE